MTKSSRFTMNFFLPKIQNFFNFLIDANLKVMKMQLLWSLNTLYFICKIAVRRISVNFVCMDHMLYMRFRCAFLKFEINILINHIWSEFDTFLLVEHFRWCVCVNIYAIYRMIINRLISEKETTFSQLPFFMIHRP